MSESSELLGTNAGFASHTFSNKSSSNATLVIELRLTSTRRPWSSDAGRFENSTTLRTGPSLQIERSGSSRYFVESRAYSTAEMTLTSNVPSFIDWLSTVGTPSTNSADIG